MKLFEFVICNFVTNMNINSKPGLYSDIKCVFDLKNISNSMIIIIKTNIFHESPENYIKLETAKY